MFYCERFSTIFSGELGAFSLILPTSDHWILNMGSFPVFEVWKELGEDF